MTQRIQSQKITMIYQRERKTYILVKTCPRVFAATLFKPPKGGSNSVSIDGGPDKYGAPTHRMSPATKSSDVGHITLLIN